jgi:hypothetical protein
VIIPQLPTVTNAKFLEAPDQVAHSNKNCNRFYECLALKKQFKLPLLFGYDSYFGKETIFLKHF